MRWLLPVIVSVLLVLVFIALPGDRGSAPEGAAAGGDDDDDAPSRLAMREGVMGIVLSGQVQDISGIRVEPAAGMQYREEITALAEVVSIAPLLELRARAGNTLAEIELAEVALGRSREAYQRLELLHGDDANISTRQLEEARAQLRSDEATLASRRQQLHSLRAGAVQDWGGRLTEWALDGDAPVFQQMVDGRRSLLLLSLSREQRLPADTEVIHVSPEDDRVNARRAEVISPAPRTGAGLQGETYYFHTGSDGLRIGMRLHAWIPLGGELIDGVHAPARSVVWQAGRPWIYLKQGEDFFYRRGLTDPVKLSGGWFIPAHEVAPGAAIVTTGAQMLLSEEYRWQIPDEDDDP